MVVVVTHHRVVGRINEDGIWVMLLAQCQMEYHFLLHLFILCVYVYICMFHGTYMEVRGQLVKINIPCNIWFLGTRLRALRLVARALTY